MKRTAAKLIAPKEFSFFEEDIPPLGPNEVLVETVSVGLCHSDIPAYLGSSAMGVHKNGYEAMNSPSYPMPIGHEPVGRIISKGKDVSRFSEGEYVTGVAAGCFSTHLIFREDERLAKVPGGQPKEFCLGEPIMCVTNIVRAARPSIGDHVAVIGCGFMGLMCISAMARIPGINLTAIDLLDSKLALADELGAGHLINPAKTDIQDEMFAHTKGAGFDIIIELTGSLKGLASALDISRIDGKGKILAPSMYSKGESFTENMAYQMMYRSPIIHVVHPWYADDYMDVFNKGLWAYENGVFPVEKFISHKFPFERIADAFDLLEKSPEDYIKGLVTFS